MTNKARLFNLKITDNNGDVKEYEVDFIKLRQNYLAIPSYVDPNLHTIYLDYKDIKSLEYDAQLLIGGPIKKVRIEINDI